MRNKKNEWNLGLLYSSIDDPKIEKDTEEFEGLIEKFAEKYSTDINSLISDDNRLLQALNDYETLCSRRPARSIMYFYYRLHMDGSDEKARSTFNLLTNRLTKAENKLLFFELALGKIPEIRQREILNNPNFSHFKHYLNQIFKVAKHTLSEAEERIMNLKHQPSSEMWTDSHDKALSSIMVDWKGKKIPVEEAASLVPTLKPKDRQRLYDKVTKEFKDLSFFSEAEMNAILTNKKINDELRGYKEPSEATILSYQNDPKVVKLLVETVSKAFPLAHKFFKIKAKILKQKSLRYYDRNAKIADIKAKLTYEESKKTLLETFRKFDPKYSQILKSYLDNGQIDVYPRKGKTGGAFCSSSYENPTFVLLNHSENTRSFTTFAHEMGHAFHSELSRSQGPFYSDYSMSLAETASTFFEALAFDAMVEKLSEREKVIALHDKINNEISTIYRQVACFNYETEIHNILREKGFISKETLADLHNKHMKSYLGSAFKLEHDDGYFFVQWSHLRRFFYVYSYAYGLLVSKAMLKKYKEDNSFKDSIEKFLSAGGSDTPENILKSIGIDVSNPKFFQEGINEMANDISTLEKMIARK